MEASVPMTSACQSSCHTPSLAAQDPPTAPQSTPLRSHPPSCSCWDWTPPCSRCGPPPLDLLRSDIVVTSGGSLSHWGPPVICKIVTSQTSMHTCHFLVICMDCMCVGIKENQLAACGKVAETCYITFTRVLGVLNHYCTLYNHSSWGYAIRRGRRRRELRCCLAWASTSTWRPPTPSKERCLWRRSLPQFPPLPRVKSAKDALPSAPKQALA